MPADAPFSDSVTSASPTLDSPTDDSPIRRVSVVIPARDEANSLHVCLTSVLGAIDELARTHPTVSARVLLILDRCTDDSARVAARFAPVIAIDADAGSVGAARALGVTAAEQAAPDAARHWIANTDADSVVPPHWLSTQLRHADRGCDVWVGTVTPMLDELDAERRAEWVRTHPPGASLGHVHGANLGFSASTYRDVGGYEHLLEHEDVRLVERAARAGARIAASDAAAVLTSARLLGRTPGGYAGYLAELGSVRTVDAGGTAQVAVP